MSERSSTVLLLLLFPLCHGQATPSAPGFCNSVDWRLLVKDCVPKVAIIKGWNIFNQNYFLQTFFLSFIWWSSNNCWQNKLNKIKIWNIYRPLHIRQGSAFYICIVKENLDKTLENGPIDNFFEVNILKAYQKVLTRLVDEGTNFNSYNGPILNSKLEWHQPKIIRDVIIQGVAETLRGNMGLRPNSSPQTTSGVTNEIQNIPPQMSSRDTRQIHRNERPRGSSS